MGTPANTNIRIGVAEVIKRVYILCFRVVARAAGQKTHCHYSTTVTIKFCYSYRS